MTVIFGEMDKWVPVSPKRVLNISWTNETVTAPLKGTANETFDFWYMLGSKADMVTCTLNSTGAATFKMDNTLGIATCDWLVKRLFLILAATFKMENTQAIPGFVFLTKASNLSIR